MSQATDIPKNPHTSSSKNPKNETLSSLIDNKAVNFGSNEKKILRSTYVNLIKYKAMSHSKYIQITMDQVKFLWVE